jgi:hypothetical protein
MLSLNLRPARLNQDHSGKSHEKEGQVTKLLKYGLDDIPLDAQEMGVITQEPYAARALYDEDKQGVKRPFLACFNPLHFNESIEGAYVMVRLKGGKELKHTECKLTGISFTKTEGGTTLMSLKVTTAPALDASLAEFYSQFGEQVDVEIRGELPGAQKDLPLNSHGAGEQTESAKPKRKPRGPNGGSMPKSTIVWDEKRNCYIDSEGNPVEGELGRAGSNEHPPA